MDYPDGTSTKASYADNGQLATTTDITGAVTTYAYNADGTCGLADTDLCQAVQVRGSTVLATVSYTYDSMDRVHTITRGNKVTTTLAYTDASQVKTETTTAADGSALRTDGYTYDSHGNVATHTITSALPPRPRPAGRPRRGRRSTPARTTTTAYGYDAYNRLVSSRSTPVPPPPAPPRPAPATPWTRPATSPARTPPPARDTTTRPAPSPPAGS